jgi:hypothetical protein
MLCSFAANGCSASVDVHEILVVGQWRSFQVVFIWGAYRGEMPVPRHIV